MTVFQNMVTNLPYCCFNVLNSLHQILDNEETVCCVNGKGHAVLPIFWLQPQPSSDPITEEDGEASIGKNENDVKVFVCVHACVC